MKLSELITYKNTLDGLSTSDIQREAAKSLGVIMHLIQSQKKQFGDFSIHLHEKRQDIITAFQNFESTVGSLADEIQEQIALQEKEWFAESYRLYSEEMIHETSDYILNRRPVLAGKTEMLLSSRLANYTDWRYAGMIIRPGTENFIQDMVGHDPLYILDQNQELLDPAIAHFTPEYQRRLRAYTIKEGIDHNILDRLPDEQFGICLVYNYFNFKPIEIIKKYLQEIFQKLRPGGVLIMTFNDCDHEDAVKLVENHFSCYTPGHLINEMAEDIGYIPIFTFKEDGPSRWVELRKLGKLSSLKGGQTLARVISK